MRKVVIPALVIIALLMGAFVAIDQSGTARGDSGIQLTQTDLAGTWHQSSPPDGVSFTAEITEDSIQITVNMNGTSGIYWLGSFDPKIIAGTILSQGDSDAMALDIFASMEPNKIFTYKDGVLSFQFSALGLTTNIEMTKGAQS